MFLSVKGTALFPSHAILYERKLVLDAHWALIIHRLLLSAVTAAKSLACILM